MPSEHRSRPRSFGDAAEEYDRLRLAPPPEAVSWFLAGDERLVLDLAAGTGQLTRRLVAAGVEVVAVEPDARMRDVLPAVPVPASSTASPSAFPCRTTGSTRS